MVTQTISAEQALTTLAKQYNAYAAVAAWFRRCDHDAYKANGVAANVLLVIVTILFKDGKDYRLTSVPETRNGVKFEWRKMEVL